MKENDFKSDTLKCYKTHAVNSDKAIDLYTVFTARR